MMRNWVLAMSGLAIVGLSACEKKESTAEVHTAATQPIVRMTPAGAPTFGTPSGMGFSTGDAVHSSGQGSGAMGYNSIGAMGTSGAISDRHSVERPMSTTEPVLPAP